MLNVDQIRRIVLDEIGDRWDLSNHHGVDLREALVGPSPIKVIESCVLEGEVHDTLIDAWLVLIEKPETCQGYRIVADADGSQFGLVWFKR